MGCGSDPGYRKENGNLACRDPADDEFLELAVNENADLIVSGDTDLLVFTLFRNIPTVPPATFVQGAVRRIEWRIARASALRRIG